MEQQTKPEVDAYAMYRYSLKKIAKGVMNIVKDCDETDDIIQETWIRYLRAKEDANQAQIENPQAYLRRIATNLALDRLRHRRRRNTISADVTNGDHLDAAEHMYNVHDSAEDRIEYSITLGKVMRELEALPTKCRTAFMLSIFEGQTHLEVSRSMGMSVSMIEKYCRRALQNVRGNVPNVFAYG